MPTCLFGLAGNGFASGSAKGGALGSLCPTQESDKTKIGSGTDHPLEMSLDDASGLFLLAYKFKISGSLSGSWDYYNSQGEKKTDAFQSTCSGTMTMSPKKTGGIEICDPGFESSSARVTGKGYPGDGEPVTIDDKVFFEYWMWPEKYKSKIDKSNTCYPYLVLYIPCTDYGADASTNKGDYSNAFKWGQIDFTPTKNAKTYQLDLWGLRPLYGGVLKSKSCSVKLECIEDRELSE